MIHLPVGLLFPWLKYQEQCPLDASVVGQEGHTLTPPGEAAVFYQVELVEILALLNSGYAVLAGSLTLPRFSAFIKWGCFCYDDDNRHIPPLLVAGGLNPIVHRKCLCVSHRTWRTANTRQRHLTLASFSASPTPSPVLGSGLFSDAARERQNLHLLLRH